MRCLYAMPSLPWPPHGGREISAHYLLAALAERGHEIHVLVRDEPTSSQLAAWPLLRHATVRTLAPTRGYPRLANGQSSDETTIVRQPPKLHKRWLRYFGDSMRTPGWLAEAVADIRPDYVEACGLEVLPWLAELPAEMPRFWLAADEGCTFQLSLLNQSRRNGRFINTLFEAAALAAYERSYAQHVDATFVVSPRDEWAMRHIAGHPGVILARNGVDHSYFSPRPAQPVEPMSVLFWGRLDFQPNLDAIAWFAREIWPDLHARYPQAVWRVIGKNVPKGLHEAAERVEGMRLIGPVTDVRPWIAGASVCVVPMRSGGGIKNKLLEAAAMARPIIATPTATRGLAFDGNTAPWRTARGAGAWQQAIEELWLDAGSAAMLGDRAGLWAAAHHDWQDHAKVREDLYALIAKRGQRAPATKVPQKQAA